MDASYVNILNGYALELLSVIPAAIMALIPVRRRLRRSPAVVYGIAAIMLAAFVIAGAMLCTYLNCDSNLVLLTCMPIMLALYGYVVDLSAGKTLFCFLYAGALSAVACLFANVLTAPVEIGNPLIPATPFSSLVCLACELLMCIFFYRSLNVKLRMLLTEEDIGGTWYTASFAAFFLMMLLVWINPSDYTTLMEGRVRIIALISVVILALILLFLIDIMWRLASHLVENTRLRQTNSLLSMEERRYAQLRSYMDTTRQMRHDFRQHLRVVSGLARDGKTDELVAYIDQMEKTAGKGNKTFCANPAVDAVASYYDAIATEQNTKIEWALDVPEKTFVREADLCSVLGNLVENALQAVSGLSEEMRIVRVTTKLVSNAMLGISVKNPYQGTVRLGRNGLPRVRRRDHGVGLVSVATIVKRYAGTMEIDTKGGQFQVSILMYGDDASE